MKLYFPLENFKKSQPFSTNYISYYAEDKLLGHTGIDMFSYHGATIYCAVDSIVTGVGNKDNPDPMRYRAVYTLVDDVEGGVAYEVSYGHLGVIYPQAGDVLKVGDKIGTQSNTGDVGSGGSKITKEMKLAGSTKGSHLHFQVRLLKKVEKKDPKNKTLTDVKGKAVMKDGCYFEVPNYKNGFRGCVDPEPFFNGEYAYKKPFTQTIKEVFYPVITQTLRYGSRGTQVKLLQKKLGITQDGVFGVQTEKAVRAYQKEKKLVVDGIVGPKTRAKLNVE